tara:strand:- start:9414 stop:9566 length:153 start_codon:yes stop_codon:yes gene_type:complete
MKERIKAGSAQHYEWVVSDGKSKIGMFIDYVLCFTFTVAACISVWVIIKG